MPAKLRPHRSMDAASPFLAGALLSLLLAGGGTGGDAAARPAPGDTVLPAHAGASPVATAPDTLPSVSLRGLDGREVELRAVADGPTVINFWATWCGPCRREMPELASLHRKLKDRGLQVVGIALNSGSPDEIRRFADRHGVDYPLFRASREWARRHFRLFGMPTTLIVDGEGRIRKRLVGPQTEERLREEVAVVLPD